MGSTNNHQSEESEAKHSQVRGVRRERQAARAKRNQPRHISRGSRQKQRNISVRAELREQPDVRKIARAVIQHALAEAERESQRIAEMEADSTSKRRQKADEGDRA